jgi:hypothetical protein
MPWEETFDVGVDTHSPVDDNDYQVPFRFTGKLALLATTLYLKWAATASAITRILSVGAAPMRRNLRPPVDQ